MKILLVDDSKSARYALRLQLQRHGVEVEAAESAESALELLKGELPDAILMDHMMPGLSGFEALELIRSQERTAHLPVVMCTSQEDPDFAAAAHRKGVVAILPKSVAAEKLPAILDQLQGILGRVPASGEPAPVSASPPRAAAPDPLQQFEGRIGGLVDARIDARLSHLIGPLLADLKRDLRERLLAEAEQIIRSRIAETGALLEALAGEQQATRGRLATLHEEGQAAASHLVEETLPDLVKIEVEAERAQIMDLVEQYLRDSTPRPVPGEDPIAVRLAALEAALAAKAHEGARRETQDAAMLALERTQRTVDALAHQVRTSLTRVYLGLLGSALIGVLAAAGVWLVLR